MSSEPLDLLTLLHRTKRALALNFPLPLWIKAELTQCNERRGNRYLQLSQKGEGQTIVARAEGSVWARDYAQVLRKRGTAAAEVLAVGREVCVQVEVEFHEVYGFRLRVLDWDPAFTLGQLELERRQVLERLEREGLLGLNALLAAKPVLQRLAVITSERAAGYADFQQQLLANPAGYRFHNRLFDVMVQGPETAPTVTRAFSDISRSPSNFDAVCLLRGGGGRLDLASFDRYEIGEAIARCPLPVLVGIGHETDETVPDAIAYKSLKTPTALAEYVLSNNAQFENAMLQDGRRIARWAQQKVKLQQQNLIRNGSQLRSAIKLRLQFEHNTVTASEKALKSNTVQALSKTQDQLAAQAEQLKALDPMRVLERGYTITRSSTGHLARAQQLQAGETISTTFASGKEVKSIIQ